MTTKIMINPEEKFAEFIEIANKIKYKNWTLKLHKKEDGFLLQWIFMERDSCNPDDPTPYEQHCRKWYLSFYSTTTELIRSAHLAAIQAEIHECNEQFLYDGARLFDPHTDYEGLSEYMKNAKQDIRD